MTVLDDKLTPVLGAKTAKALAEALNLHTVADLVRHYPRRYDERDSLTDIAGLELDEHATLLARVENVTKRQMKNKPGSILEVTITDGRRRITCAFFGKQAWRDRELRIGTVALFAGKVTAFRTKLQLSSPQYHLLESNELGEVTEEAMEEFMGIIPVYPAAAGVQTWNIAKAVRQVLDTLDPVEDPMPMELLAAHGLQSLSDALRAIHRPDDWAQLDSARRRLKWDEALSVQLIFAQRRHSAVSKAAPVCPPRADGLLAAFDQRLPFELTQGQKDVGAKISADLSVPQPMNLLLQGEVGSGKTVVALRAMLQAVDSGRQAAMLAPTEVLAAQHARSLREMLGDLGQAGELGAAEQSTKITLLTGSLGAKDRKQALLDAASGAAGIVVGTHALIQETVSFADLGFVVVDEQHRFGVEQRDALRSRGANGGSPHVLVMTATPIPRTVAMTVYGDLEITALRDMPAGRSPIATTVVPVSEKPAWLDRAWQRVREEVGKGHQAYVVCPRIGDEPASDKGDKRPPLAVLDVAAELAQGVLKGLRVGVLHGRMPADDKDEVMRAFAAAKLDVLVATTVIEVGVNVPNATAMVIMDADRFGVSQLHQLRGRVGRGSVPGLCLLVTEALDGTSTRDRLDAVESTTDGFKLSQLDLEIRREGDILGSAQSGKRSGLKLLSLLRDEDVIAEARERAQDIVGLDPTLADHPRLAAMVASVVDEESAEYLEKN